MTPPVPLSARCCPLRPGHSGLPADPPGRWACSRLGAFAHAVHAPGPRLLPHVHKPHPSPPPGCPCMEACRNSPSQTTTPPGSPAAPTSIPTRQPHSSHRVGCVSAFCPRPPTHPEAPRSGAASASVTRNPGKTQEPQGARRWDSGRRSAESRSD